MGYSLSRRSALAVIFRDRSLPVLTHTLKPANDVDLFEVGREWADERRPTTEVAAFVLSHWRRERLQVAENNGNWHCNWLLALGFALDALPAHVWISLL